MSVWIQLITIVTLRHCARTQREAIHALATLDTLEMASAATVS